MFVRCSSCQGTFKLEGEHEALDADLANGAVACPLCSEWSASAVTVRMGDAAKHHLTKQEFWAASNGFGMPDEVVTELEFVEAMLLAHKIVSVKLRHSASKRVIVDALILENGITLHFTASGDGAVIFKSTRTKEKEDAS